MSQAAVSKKGSNMSVAQPGGLNKNSSQKSIASPQKSVSPSKDGAKSNAGAALNASASQKSIGKVDVTKSQQNVDAKSVSKASASPDQKSNKFAALKKDFKAEDAKSGSKSPPKSPDQKSQSKNPSSPPKNPSSPPKSTSPPKIASQQQKPGSQMDVNASKQGSQLNVNASQPGVGGAKSALDVNKSQNQSLNKSGAGAQSQAQLNKNASQKSISPSKDLKSQKSLSPSKDLKSQKSVSPSKDLKSQKSISPSKDLKSQKSLSPSKQNDLNKSIDNKSALSKNDKKGAQQPIGQSQQLQPGVANKLASNQPSTVAQSVALKGASTVNNSGTQLMGVQGLKDANQSQAQGPLTTVTQSQNVNNSLNNLDRKLKVLSEKEIEEQEYRDDQTLSSHKQKLEGLQRQKPPTKTEDLIQYLLKRLDAAESSIKASEEVIMNERQLRHSTTTQMKTEIQQLQQLVEVERTNLSQKVTAELDLTLKKAVKEKLQIQQEMGIVLESKDKLQRDFDELQEMYNKQVRQNIELQQNQQRGGGPMPVDNNRGGYQMTKAQDPMPKQSVYLPPINKYQAPAEPVEDDDDDFWYQGPTGGGGGGNQSGYGRGMY